MKKRHHGGGSRRAVESQDFRGLGIRVWRVEVKSELLNSPACMLPTSNQVWVSLGPRV